MLFFYQKEGLLNNSINITTNTKKDCLQYLEPIRNERFEQPRQYRSIETIRKRLAARKAYIYEVTHESFCKYPAIKEAKDYLETNEFNYAFMHEAALAIWGLSYNQFLINIDALVFNVDTETPKRIELPSKHILRLWLANTFSTDDAIRSVNYNCRVLNPYLVLELLPSSPNDTYRAKMDGKLRY